ncbi:V-type ATP synthase subunit D [Candidatus Micrarchaeota archaeon]|nr:V-type ATP synthase subunit D [Candidatus Micrarchaeota archaeon]
MAATDVNPTRMELIKTKDRIALAKKGHKLLKQKRDALILEFFKMLKKAQDLRSELAKKVAVGHRSLGIAESYHSIQELEKVALDLRREVEIDIEVRNVMGVKIPVIDAKMEKKDFLNSPNYSVAGTSAKIDAAVTDFNEIVDMTVKLAETETAIKRLIIEIEKTKRRVNALEFVVMPKLEDTKKLISFRLDEMERDSFVSLKSIKRKLEKEKKSSA